MSPDLAHVKILLRALLDEAAVRGADPVVVVYAAGLLDDVLTELAERRDTRRPNTRELCQRIAKLERQLADRDPGERAAIIRARLGLGRSRFYELRKAALSPETGPDSHAVQFSETATRAARRNIR